MAHNIHKHYKREKGNLVKKSWTKAGPKLNSQIPYPYWNTVSNVSTF